MTKKIRPRFNPGLFKLFRKKPRVQDKAFIDLSLMLSLDESRPTYRKDVLECGCLDFSLESLKPLDRFLDKVRHDSIPEDALIIQVLRTGACRGEVMRRTSEVEYHWLYFEDACKIVKSIEKLGDQLGTSAVLWSSPDHVCFPLVKVLKFISNGKEDSTYTFAKVLLNGTPENFI